MKNLILCDMKIKHRQDAHINVLQVNAEFWHLTLISYLNEKPDQL